MAIEFKCPHCLESYRLKDEFAGKRATCRNQNCRKVLIVPQPGAGLAPSIAELGGIAPQANGRKDDTPIPRTPADVEAAALAALNEAPQEAKSSTEQVVAVTCDYCGHQWTEPASKAGKNVLCPDPECRRQVKVPAPKGKKDDDWREGGNRPSLAKENFEKPVDVVDAQAKVVSKEAWEKGGGAEQYLEPIPLKRKIFFGLLIATPIVALLAGGVYWWQSHREGQHDLLMADAVREFEAGAGELQPVEQDLYWAMLHMAAGEYALRQNSEPAAELKSAVEHINTARDKLRQAAAKDDGKRTTAAERNALACELALITLGLGGTPEQIENESRFPWLPSMPSGPARYKATSGSVHLELQRTLQSLQTLEFDLKTALLRRLTRDLARRGPDAQGLAEFLPIMLFKEEEQPEAMAIMALELHRLDPGSPLIRKIADELKKRLAAPGRRDPVPASAQTLWLVLGIDKVPNIVPQAPKGHGQPVSQGSRLAYVGLFLLKNQQEDAMELALRPGIVRNSQAGEQLRALALYAEWSPDPGPAFDHAVQIIGRHQKGDFPPPPYVVYRLVQLAAAAGKTEPAKQLAESLSDEGLKEWAKAEVVHHSASSSNRSAIDAGAATAPENPKDLRAGHAWSHFWLARHNARVSGDRTKEINAVALWSKGTIQPFGYAGIALGLKEQ